MGILESFKRIRKPWAARAASRLARGAGVRESFQEQLEQYYAMLVQSVESGNEGWLNPVLDAWVDAQPQTELDEGGTSILPVLNEILTLTFDVARENLEPEPALELMRAVLPVHTSSFEYVSQKETIRQVEQVASELVEARRELERLDRSKSDFISIAAHELKTPLTLIEGYAGMLREQARQMGDQAEILMKGIDNGTRRLREIVDDMIDVSLIDNDLLALNFQPMWLDRLLRAVEQEFQETLDLRRLELRIQAFPGSQEMIFGDNERIYQALHNLVANAIKYTPDGGKITVDGRKLPGFLEITVADTGIGVDIENQSRIFEKFGRIGNVSLHSSGKTKFMGGGPGLGLPITRGIIEAHGGTIWVESPGSDEKKLPGATFHILLPIRLEPPDERIARLFNSMDKPPQTENIILN